MNIVRGYPVCDNCKYSKLLKCEKYNCECLSVFFHPERHQLPCVQCLDNEGYEEISVDEDNKENQANDIMDFNPHNNIKQLDTSIGYFHLPGPENLNYYESLFTMLKAYPELLYDNRRPLEIYGAFPGCTWNGRTPNFGGESLCEGDLIQIRDRIEALGLNINLTWNNHCIGDTDVYDRFCNTVTKVFHNGKHAITVASPILYKYLKEKYPNYTYYSSIIMTTNDEDFTIKDASYDMYFWPRTLNNNWDKLNMIPDEQRANIEFLVNDACTPICQRMGHYNTVNSDLLNRRADSLYGYCTIDHDFMSYNNTRWPITINTEDIDQYINSGFHHFKIASRGDSPAIILLKVIRYLIKPQFVDDAFAWAINLNNITEEQRIKRKMQDGCNCIN